MEKIQTHSLITQTPLLNFVVAFSASVLSADAPHTVGCNTIHQERAVLLLWVYKTFSSFSALL